MKEQIIRYIATIVRNQSFLYKYALEKGNEPCDIALNCRRMWGQWRKEKTILKGLNILNAGGKETIKGKSKNRREKE